MLRSAVRLTFAITFTMIASGCTGSGPAADPVREIPQYTLDQFLSVTAINGGSFSPDGSKILVSSDETGIFNAYAISVEDGSAEQLTDSTEDAVFVNGYFPHDERILYSSDQGGNELDHLYVRTPDGEVTDLTPGEKLKANFGGWSGDEKSFFILTNERDGRYFDTYEYDIDTYERTLFYQDEVGLLPADISPDKRYMAFAKTITTVDADVILYDRETDTRTNLTEHEGQGPIANAPVAFTADSKALIYSTDAGSEFSYLVRYDLESGETTDFERAEWDITGAGFSRDGRYLSVRVNEDARTDLRLYTAADHAPVELPDLAGLNITGVRFAHGTDRFAFFASSDTSPTNLYVWSLGDPEPKKLSNTLNPAIAQDDLVTSEVVRFDSFDGVEIPGILYKPHNASAENQVPAIVLVHGGPGGQSRVGYRDVTQYLVNHGYAVYAINNRGSSGYGKTFFQMDDRRHGQDDLDDCVASKQMLIDTGWVDPDRIGIMGGSYGGYMVLAALAFRPDEFEVGVNLFGVSNWLRTMQSIPPWWEAFREALYTEMGHPVEDEEYLRSISPVFHAENIVKPLLVLQGANDPRVIQAESDDIVAAARGNDAPVEYIIFDDEGHGFTKRENRKEGYEAILKFLDRYLKGDGSAGEAAETQEAA